jgi:hypothetical protein
MKKKFAMFLMLVTLSLVGVASAVAQSRTHSTAQKFNLVESNVRNFYVLDGVQLPALDFRGYNFFMLTGDIKSLDVGNGNYLIDISVDGQNQFVSCTYLPGLIDQMTSEYKNLFADAKRKLIYKIFPGDGHYRIYLVCELTGVTIIGFQAVN